MITSLQMRYYTIDLFTEACVHMKHDVIYQWYLEVRELHQYLASIPSCSISWRTSLLKKGPNAHRLSKKHWLVKEGATYLVCRVMIRKNCILFPFVVEEEEWERESAGVFEQLRSLVLVRYLHLYLNWKNIKTLPQQNVIVQQINQRYNM